MYLLKSKLASKIMFSLTVPPKKNGVCEQYEEFDQVRRIWPEVRANSWRKERSIRDLPLRGKTLYDEWKRTYSKYIMENLPDPTGPTKAMTSP